MAIWLHIPIYIFCHLEKDAIHECAAVMGASYGVKAPSLPQIRNIASEHPLHESHRIGTFNLPWPNFILKKRNRIRASH